MDAVKEAGSGGCKLQDFCNFKAVKWLYIFYPQFPENFKTNFSTRGLCPL